MANKSAAKMKVAEFKKNLPPMQEVFEKQVEGMKATLEIQIKQDDRFDTLAALRDSYRRFHGEGAEMPLEDAKRMAGKIKSVHCTILGLVEELTLKQVLDDNYKNPMDEMADFGDPEGWEDVFDSMMLFAAMSPYGQFFDDLRSRMVEEKGKRE